MNIGVISDTHLLGYDEKLREIVENKFHDCEAIIHAGDFIDVGVIDIFHGKKLIAVYGNMDIEEIKKHYPQKDKIVINGQAIILTHDLSSLEDKDKHMANCVVFGHTHNPVNFVSGGLLFFNPGSSSCNRFRPQKTIGILHLGNEIKGEIVVLDEA